MRRDACPDVRLRTSKTLAIALAVPGYREFVFGAEAIHIPGLDGEYVIEPGQPPLEIELGIGVLTVRTGGREWLAALHGGSARVRDDEVRLLANAVEFAGRIEVTRARAAQSDAAQRLTGDREDADARTALQRANLRLAVAARVHP